MHKKLKTKFSDLRRKDHNSSLILGKKQLDKRKRNTNEREVTGQTEATEYLASTSVQLELGQSSE